MRALALILLLFTLVATGSAVSADARRVQVADLAVEEVSPGDDANARGFRISTHFEPGSGRYGGTQTARLWRDGSTIELTAPSGRSSRAYGINEHGDVVGWAEFQPTAAEAGEHAFLWSGTMRDLGSLAGPSGRSVAYDINDAREVAGTTDVRGGGKHAFVWQQTMMKDLGTLPGDTDSEAFGINELGEIVGTSYQRLCGECVPRAVLWRNGSAVDLNTLLPSGSGWVLTAAMSIDDDERIVGRGTLNGQPRFFELIK